MFFFFKGMLLGLVILFFNDMLRYCNNFLNKYNSKKPHKSLLVNTLTEAPLLTAGDKAFMLPDQLDAMMTEKMLNTKLPLPGTIPFLGFPLLRNSSGKRSKLFVYTCCTLLQFFCNPFLSGELVVVTSDLSEPVVGSQSSYYVPTGNVNKLITPSSRNFLRLTV